MKFVPLEEADQAPQPLKFVPLEAEKPEPVKAEAKPEPTPTVAPKPEPEIDPTTGKPYPELRALPEPSVWDKLWAYATRNETLENKAKAANEYAARKYAAENKVPLSQAYKITKDSHRPVFNPEGRASLPAAKESAIAAVESLADMPEAAVNTALRAIRGGDVPVKDRTWLDRSITSTTQEPRQAGRNVEAFSNIGQSLGYSVTTMVAGAVSDALTGPVGAMTVGTAVPYRASKDEFLDRIRTNLNNQSKKLYGKPIDEKQWNKAREEFEDAAVRYGAWEAVPEAVSNLVMLKAFTAPLRAVNSADKIAEIAKRGLAAQIAEQGTETVTALGQNREELRAGLTKEELNIADAFRQQFVQTLATTGGLAAGAKGVQQVNKFYENYVEPKVRPGSALARAIQADLNTYLERQQPAATARPRFVPLAAEAPEAERPELTELQAARRPDLEQEPTSGPPLTAMEAARNQALEVEPTDELGIPEDAGIMAEREAAAEARRDVAGRAVQRQDIEDERRTAEGRAERAALSMEAPSELPEPPSYVTQPSTDEYGTPVPSGAPRPAGRPATAFDRGLDIARSVTGQLDVREERERAALDANKQRLASAVSQAFNREALPDLGPILGASWTRSELAKNPTPEEYQDAAYARLEELDGQRPADAGVSFERGAAPAVAAREPAVAPAQAPQAATTETVEAPVAAKAAESVKDVWEGVKRTTRGEVEEVPTSALDNVPQRNKADTTTDAYKALKASIAKTGIIDPITLARSPQTGQLEVFEGNHRLQAARELGIETVPVVLHERNTPSETTPLYGRTPKSELGVTQPARTEEEAIQRRQDEYQDAINAAYEELEAAQPTEKPRVAEAPKAVEAKEERPAQPAATERAAPLELEASRREDLEVEPPAITEVKQSEKALTKAGTPRVRAPGAGRKKTEGAKTKEERTKQSAGLNKFNRDVSTLIRLATELSERQDREGFESDEEFEYKEAIRDMRADQLRAAIYGLAQKSGMAQGYIDAKDYIRKLKPALRDRAKALYEGTAKIEDYHEIPPKPADLVFKERKSEEYKRTRAENKAQRDLEERTIHSQLDEEEKQTVAEHYGSDSYDKVKDKFVADVIKAMNEGLDAVAEALRGIIRKLQAGVLAAIIAINPNYMSAPVPVAIPKNTVSYEYVKATVPEEVFDSLSPAGREAFSLIFPAIQAELKAKNKLFLLVDKPNARLVVFTPDGNPVLDKKVLLGLQLQDFYVGNTENPANRITPAGGYVVKLRNAARGITEEGGNEWKTAHSYDFGKVFVLDKAAPDGSYSVTLFHSVWTHERDAARRLAALEKEGPEDSRYSFGCVNVDKPSYKYLLDNYEEQMDGATMFIVPDTPGAVMDFMNGKAVAKGDLRRKIIQPKVEKVTKTEPGEPTPAKETARAEQGILREEQKPSGGRAMAARRRRNEEILGLTEEDIYRIEQQLNTDPDPNFYGFTTLTGALLYITNSPNQLEAELAARLLQDDTIDMADETSFGVVETDSKGIDPYAKDLLDDDAVGVYVPYTQGGSVLVRGTSYGIDQGINNEIVLHEAMHAIGAKKITYVELAEEQNAPVPARLAEAVHQLRDLMDRTRETYAKLLAAGTAPATLARLAEAKAFTDIQEFYAYGLTDPDMKLFLRDEVPGVSTKTTGFDRFVEILMRLFGVNPALKSGLKDLLLISNEIMQVKKPSDKAMAELTRNANAELINTAKRTRKNIQTAERDLEASRSTRAIIGNVGNVQTQARTPNILSRFLERNLAVVDIGTVKGAVRLMPTSSLFRIAIANGITSAETVQRQYSDRGAMRHRIHVEMDEIVGRWRKLKKKDELRLADAMHLSTDIAEDPSLPQGTKSKELANLWRQLSPEAKQLYKDVRDFYKKNGQAFLASTKQRIANSNLQGNINDPTTPKGQLYAEIVKTYEEGMGVGPYFPLMREGTNWVAFGKGSNTNFQMFESEKDMTQFMQDQIAERSKRGDKRDMRELVAAGEADFGYDIGILRDKLAKENLSLKRVFSAIDSTNFGSRADVENLKREVFQMHLWLMPEQSMRRMFMPRKNRAGYSRDALRSFVVLGGRVANGVAGAYYNYKIRDALDSSMSALKNNPDKAKLELVVKEMQTRINGSINPDYSPNVMDDVARFANKFTFMYLLTDMKQVFNNVWSLPSKGLPTLLKYFSIADIIKESASFLSEGLVNQVGISRVDANGNVSYTMPSFGSSAVVRGSRELQYAVKMMEELEASGRGTVTTDVYFAEKNKATTMKGAVFNTVVHVTGALNQGSERATREIMYLTTYKLLRRQGMKPNEAVYRALDITQEALYRYAPDEVPPFMNKWGPKILFQLKKYSAFTTNFYLMNMAEATGKLPSNHRSGAVYAMMGSYMMAIVGAGLGGAFGASTMAWLLGMLHGWWEEYADEPTRKTLGDLSPMKWFTEVYLPNEFGDMNVPGTDMKLSDILAHGLLNSLTESDLASSISEGSMWLQDLPGSLDMNEMLDSISMRSMLGASAGVFHNIFVSGVQDWAKGDINKALEKWMPIKMFRSPMIAHRLATEGLKDKDYNDVIKSSEFKEGHIYMQALGFRPESVVRIEDMNYFVKSQEYRINQDKQHLVDRWVQNTIRRNREGAKDVEKDIKKFNRMYGYDDKLIIDSDTLDTALDNKLDEQENVVRGVSVIEKPEFDWLTRYRKESLRKVKENRPK